MTMRISQRVDYAMQALVLLASQREGSFLAAGEVAERLHLPRRFVEQQVTALSHAGIVDCRRGAGGGCALAKPASSISVRDIIFALQGDIIDVPQQPFAATAEMWSQAVDALGVFLDGVTLADLAARQAQLDAAAQPMYYI